MLFRSTNVINTTQTIQKLTNELHHVQELLKEESMSKSEMGFKLHAMLDATKFELQKKTESLMLKMGKYNEIVEINEKLKEELNEARTKNKECVENLMMIQEDMSQMKFKISNLKDKIRDQNIIIEEENRTVQDLEIKLKLQKEGLIQKKEVSMEGTLFQIVWDDKNREGNNSIKYRSVNNKQNERDEKKNETTSHLVEQVRGTQEIELTSVNMTKYTYLRPTYGSLINDLIPNNEERKVNYNPPFPIWLHVVIRGIFDSKYTEVLLSYNKGKRISRFPDFVYSWLGVFDINKATRKITLLEYTEKDAIAKRNRINLLSGLKAASNAKLWEVKIFTDFLEEQMGLDELAYFLHCRFILLQGPHLQLSSSGFCVTYFISKDRVFDTIDKIMSQYSADEVKLLKSKITEYAKQYYKNTDAFDYSMVLRILLEFYRKEKKENHIRFENIFSLSKSSLESACSIFPFSSFYKIFSESYDKNITELELCSLYRESYIAGGGAITSNSTLLTFSETPFWINYLRLKGQNDTPKYDDRGEIKSSNDKGKECALVYSYY